jgi:porin
VAIRWLLAAGLSLTLLSIQGAVNGVARAQERPIRAVLGFDDATEPRAETPAASADTSPPQSVAPDTNATHSGCSPFEGLQLFDGISPAAGKNAQAAASLFDGFEFPYDDFRRGAGPSGLDIVGNPAAGDQSAAGRAGAPSIGTPPLPPFGGARNSRPKLTGDWCGLRDQLRDDGFTFDISATTYYQGVASGGLEDIFRFGGRNDYLVNVDGQKAGLWQGFGIYLHGETVYGDSVNLATGAVVPVDIGRAHPVFFGDETALTAVKFNQVVSDKLILYAGKINTIDNVQQPFMPGRGLDAGFMNAAFVWNPILGRTMNYATLGAGAAILADGYPLATLTVYDTNNDTTTSGFNVLFDNGAIIYPTVSLPTTFFGMPGHQSVWGAYSSGRYAIVSPESLNLIPQVLQGQLPPTAVTTLVRGSWWITYLFDQALWVDPSDKTRSWGVFGNIGISDAKPNPIHWSAIVGIGGSSALPGRKLDTFGIAYYYLGFSDGFKNVARLVTPVGDERGLELFYNVGVTPWCHVTADLQVITPILERVEASLVLGLRAKIDF